MKQINIELLREFVDYNPETGSMTWKERDIKHFKCLRDCNRWNNRYAGQECGTSMYRGHKLMRISGKPFYIHRAAFAHHFGYWPTKEIDHKNQNPTDNRLSNLRETNENNRNKSKQKNNTSGYTGVSWDKNRNKWRVAVSRKYRGLFEDLELAGFVAELTRDKLGYHKNHGK